MLEGLTCALTKPRHVSYLLKCLLTVQAGGGHLRQQDGHVLLLLPQPDQPLTDMGVHHTQRHLLLPTQSLVEVCKVGSDTGPCALCRAGDLTETQRIVVNVSRKAELCTFS